MNEMQPNKDTMRLVKPKPKKKKKTTIKTPKLKFKGFQSGGVVMPGGLINFLKKKKKAGVFDHYKASGL